MKPWKECKRKECRGSMEWAIDKDDGKLQGTCWSCGRPAVRRAVDTTPPAFAELLEAGLNRLGGT